ncbi:glycosyltransferase family 4 protein [Williamsia sp. M5A3_1d]
MNRKRTLATVGMYLPSSRLETAGGLYYYRFSLATSKILSVIAFADGFHVSPDAAKANRNEPFESRIIPRARWTQTLVGDFVQTRLRGLSLISLDRGFVHGIRSDPDFVSTVRSASIVELQWTEYFGLAPLVRNMNPRAAVVGVVHDVVLQRIEREVARRGVFYRCTAGRTRIKMHRSRERRLLSQLDHVVVFSEKDKLLVSDIHEDAVCHIIPPEVPSYAVSPAEKCVVLFEGALSRPENVDAVRYLVGTIWPDVLRARPDAILRIAGSGAPDDLNVLLEAHPSVHVTGRLADMADAYAGISLCVAPLQLGAGLKFKSASAILSGVPLVSTTCGIEGIPFGGDIWCVADDPAAFASAIVSALEERGRAWAEAEQLKAAASREFGSDALQARVAQLYTEILQDMDDDADGAFRSER